MLWREDIEELIARDDWRPEALRDALLGLRIGVYAEDLDVGVRGVPTTTAGTITAEDVAEAFDLHAAAQTAGVRPAPSGPPASSSSSRTSVRARRPGGKQVRLPPADPFLRHAAAPGPWGHAGEAGH